MIIDGFQKLTLVDYPNVLATLVFTRGCNFRCSFCQNSPLLECSNEKGLFSVEEIINYLKKRKGLLEGVVITGGEPLLQSDIKDFIKEIKNLGYLVKLDTNGSFPKKLKELIDENLLDYIAMDIKNIKSKYEKVTDSKVSIKNITESINIIKDSNVDHEFRTTIVKEFHSIDDIEKICDFIGKNEKYYLQNFENSSNVIDKSLHSFSKEELVDIKNKLISKYPNLIIRGL